MDFFLDKRETTTFPSASIGSSASPNEDWPVVAGKESGGDSIGLRKVDLSLVRIDFFFLNIAFRLTSSISSIDHELTK